MSRFNDQRTFVISTILYTGEGGGGGAKELPEHEQHPRLEPYCDQVENMTENKNMNVANCFVSHLDQTYL